jgi:hypothetical protein
MPSAIENAAVGYPPLLLVRYSIWFLFLIFDYLIEYVGGHFLIIGDTNLHIILTDYNSMLLF